jgi:hypothetical protein
MRTKPDLRSILTSEQIFQCAPVVFLFLTIFFLTLPASYLSLYRLMLILFDGYGSWGVYDLVFNSVYWGSFVTGLLLLMSFLISTKNRRRVEKIVAINCALHGFVIQAFSALGLHRYSLETYHPMIHGIGWIVLDIFLAFILVATLILLAAALTLLANRKWARKLGLIASTLLLVGHIGSRVVRMHAYSVLPRIFLGSPELTVILGIASAMSIYYLWKFH